MILLPTEEDKFHLTWGNPMCPTKQAQTMQLVLQNVGGWLQRNTHQKNQIIQQFIEDKNIDIFLTMENNVAWN